MDTVVFEQLAASFIPPASSLQPDGQASVPGQDAVYAEGLHRLREYVVAALVTRYIKRGCSRDASLQRAGVNALRFSCALLTDAAMREPGSAPLAALLGGKAAATVRLLLRSCLEVLWPSQGSASPGLKEALYRWVVAHCIQEALAR